MDFEEVCNYFGGSIFPEQFRGNLAELAFKLDQCEQDPNPQTAEIQARNTLLRAIWHSLSANPIEAFPLILKLISQADLPKRWTFRAHAYRILLASWSEQPPCFRFCSLSGSSANVTSEYGEFGDYVAHVVGEGIEACHELMQHASRQDVAECYLFIGIHFLPSALEMARGLHPTQGREGAVASDLGLELLQKCWDALQTAQRLLDVSGMLSVSAYANSLLYELAYSQGLPIDHLYLDEMRAQYTAAGDAHGLGLCALAHGDRSCSTPFTSPIVLNFYIRDDWDDCGGDSSQYSVFSKARTVLQDLEETVGASDSLLPLTEELCRMSFYRRVDTEAPPDLAGVDGSEMAIEKSVIQEAFHFYEVARTCFETAGSVRGVAAAVLREACLRESSMKPAGYMWTPEEVEPIANLFSRAESLFAACGDIWNQRLAETHRILVYARNSDRLALGWEIGRWGKETGNEEFALHLGLLALRLARHARYLRGQIHEARHHIQTALVIFDAGTRRSSAMLQSLALEIDCLASLGDYQSALLKFEDMRGLSRNVVALFFEDLEMYSDQMLEDPHGLQKRIYAHQHSIKKACELAISIVPRYTKDIAHLEDVIGDLLGKVKELDFTEYTHASTTLWIAKQEEHLNFLRASLAIDGIDSSLNTEDGLPLALQQALVIDDQPTPLPQLYRVILRASMGDKDFAASLLSEVKDNVAFPTDLPQDLLSKHYLLQKELQGRQLLLSACIQVEDWERSRGIMDALEKLSPGYFTSVSSYTRILPWQRCLQAGLIMEGLEHHGLALRFLIQSREFFSLSQDLRQTMSGTGERLVQLQTGGDRLTNSLIRVLLHLRDQGTYEQVLQPLSSSRVDLTSLTAFANPAEYLSGDPEADALVALENDRMRLFNELESTPSDINRNQIIRDQYHIQLLLDLKSLPRPRTGEEDIELERLEREKEDAQDLLQRVNMTRDWTKRPKPSRESTWKFIKSGALDNTLVIYVSVDEDGMALFGISDKGIEHASFNLTENTREIRRLVNMCLQEFTVNEGRESWIKALDPLTRLSTRILGPLEDAIANTEHIIFISSGDLTPFPFGALMFRSAHLIMQKAVSQAPSLYGLLYLMTRDTDKSSSSRPFVMAKPGSLRQARKTREQELPMAGVEALLLADLFGTKPRNAADITREDFIQEFGLCDWLHLGTHGSLDLDAPFHSSLSLKERLRVIDLLAVQSTVKVVVFSACLSGLGKATDRGDIVGFSHAVLAAGANAYIGALWHSNDLSTLVHMLFFYKELVHHEGRASIATAWHRATLALFSLKQEKNEGIVSVIDDFVTCWDRVEAEGLEPGKFVRNGRRKLEDLKDEILSSGHEIDFKHPFFWAPFITMGNAGQYYMGQEGGKVNRNGGTERATKS